jgi:hypothetical protein
MRLIAWNANFNNRRRTLEEDAELLAPTCADVLIISETAPPTVENPLSAHFVGGTPGLAVSSSPKVNLAPLGQNPSAPTLAMGFQLEGAIELDLLAIWPVSKPGTPSYHRVLMRALELYSDMLSSGRAIMIGDFNSSARVTSQRTSHPRFVEAARDLGLVSLYHERSGEAHGKESHSTYFHSRGQAFHIDYCFVSRQLLGSAKLLIGDQARWTALSDHLPLIVDIDPPAAPTD